MKKYLFGSLIALSFISCSKGPIELNLIGDKTHAHRGETVTLTVDATNKGKITLLQVEGTLYYEKSGSSLIQTLPLGVLYESTEKGASLSGSFVYTIPYTVASDSLIGGDYDYIEFVAYGETSQAEGSTNFNVQINP